MDQNLDRIFQDAIERFRRGPGVKGAHPRRMVDQTSESHPRGNGDSATYKGTEAPEVAVQPGLITREELFRHLGFEPYDWQLRIMDQLKAECRHNPGKTCLDVMQAGSGFCCMAYARRKG